MSTSTDLPATAPESPSRRAREPWGWRSLGIVLLTFSLSIVLLRTLAFDGLLSGTERLFSADDQISAANRERLSHLMVEIAVWGGFLALLCFVMSTLRGERRVRALLYTDSLQSADRAVPDPMRVLAMSSMAGLTIIALAALHFGTPVDFQWLFAKEGPLELLTFGLLILSAGLCARAASHRYRHAQAAHENWAALIYITLGIVLFVTGMEEISWGQTYLAWETPESWASINSQHETTLHNLLDQHTLHVVAQRITYLFVAAALVAIFLSIKVGHAFVGSVAPHFSTIGILLLTGYAAHRFHLEVSEALFSIFAACYAWRIYLAARIDSRSRLP